MTLDINMLKGFYADYSTKVENVRKSLNRPLTYAEKVLYAHLYSRTQGHIQEERIMLNSALTGLPCRMPLLRWHSYSS